MNSLIPDYLSGLTFSHEEIRTLRRLGEYSGREQLFTKQKPEVLDLLLNRAFVESSESSNRIEGAVAGPGRIEGLIAGDLAPQTRSEQEIAGYRDGLSLIHESWRHMPFSVNVIRQLHTSLFRYHPVEGGRYKSTDNEIVDRNADGSIARVRFRAVPAVATPGAMESMATNYRAISSENEPLVILPLAILDFLCIHPFADGNGRVARLLTQLLLYKAGYLVGRFISLERIIEESKETYYETLEASSQDWEDGVHDSGPWRRYFWGTLLAAYEEYERRVREGSRGSKSALVREMVARQAGSFRLAELAEQLPDISRETIRNVLRKLRDQGVVLVEGRGRGARWRKNGP